MAASAGFTIDVAENYTHFVDNKKPEYLAKFASGKIPAFETKDGFTLFEGVVIARYGELHSSSVDQTKGARTKVHQQEDCSSIYSCIFVE